MSGLGSRKLCCTLPQHPALNLPLWGAGGQTRRRGGVRYDDNKEPRPRAGRIEAFRAGWWCGTPAATGRPRGAHPLGAAPVAHPAGSPARVVRGVAARGRARRVATSRSYALLPAHEATGTLRGSWRCAVGGTGQAARDFAAAPQRTHFPVRRADRARAPSGPTGWCGGHQWSRRRAPCSQDLRAQSYA